MKARARNGHGRTGRTYQSVNTCDKRTIEHSEWIAGQKGARRIINNTSLPGCLSLFDWTVLACNTSPVDLGVSPEEFGWEGGLSLCH